MYNCAHCAKQTILCRRCDRGNIYCSKVCAAVRRRHSLRRAGKQYQTTLKAKCGHAERQKRYRLRITEKVTHQGSIAAQECDSLEEKTFVKSKVRSVAKYRRELASEMQCHHCGRVCGPFGRYEFWRGGRAFKRFRRRSESDTRDRGRDSPPLPR